MFALVPAVYSKDRPGHFPKSKVPATNVSPPNGTETAAKPNANKPPTTSSSVSLTSNGNPVRYGAPIILTATITPNTASGTVTFYSGGIPVGSSPVAQGISTLTTELLDAGSDYLTAHYEGNSSVLPSTSALLLQTIADNADVGFPYYTTVNVGYNPPPNASWVSVGDVNLDGKEDLVAILAGTNQVAICLGTGTGTFDSPLYFNTGAEPYALVIGDFNQDGIPDLAVTSDDGIDILLGTGGGQFLAYVPYATAATGSGSSSFGLALADFNGDGIPDLVVTDGVATNSAGTSGYVSVFLGVGNGTFPTRTDYTVGQLPQAVAVGDFNNDGHSDFAVADILDDTVYVYLGNGSGGFTQVPGPPVTTGDQPNDITPLLLHGTLDLVVANAGDNQIQILTGNGAGGFTPQSGINVGNEPDSLVVADFNGDLVPDIAVVNSSDNTVSVLLNINGQLTAPVTYGGCGSCNYVQVAAGDFNNDGVTDMVIADEGQDTPPGGLNILLGQGCTYSVYPTSIYQDDTSASQSVVLAGNGAACTWTATNTNSWITLNTSSGSGSSGSVSITLAANNTGVDRTGTVIIANQTITVTQRSTTEVYTDVTANDYYFDAVNLLAAKGITTGCTATTFCPTEDVTRAQMAVFIVRSIFGGDNFTPPSTQIFEDVTPSTFGYAWIQELSALGITTGCAPNLFCPTANIPRNQMAVFIIRARFGTSTPFTYPTTPYFTDVPSSAFGFEWIQRMAYDAITSGCTATTYCPSNPVTRGDMAIFIMKGEFNDLLATGTPVISIVSPAILTAGQTGVFTVTGMNTNFVAGQTQLVFGTTSGITVNSVNVNSPTSLAVSLTASAAAPQNPNSIYVQTGTQSAVLPNGLAIQ